LDWSNGTNFQLNVKSGKIVKQTKTHLDHVTGFMAFDILRQTGTNPCAVNNGGCQQLCLVKGRSNDYEHMSYHCACETHFTLFKNNTCSGNESFYMNYFNSQLCIFNKT